MRVHNWPKIIAEQLKIHMQVPFVWGEKDCCLAVADIVNMYAGIDIAEKFRGKYKTALGSKRALKKYGKGSIKDTASDILPSIPVSEAGRGDLVLVDTDAGESLGILFGTRAWAMAETGMVAIGMDKVTHAWRIE